MTRRVNEKTTALYTGQLVDENGVDLALIMLLTFTLTIYDVRSGSIINGWDHKNALNANGVTVSSTGAVSFTMSPDDNPIVNANLDTELHTMYFEGTYGTGSDLKHEFHFRVINLNKAS